MDRLCFAKRNNSASQKSAAFGFLRLGFSGLAMFLVSILFRSQKDILRFFYFLFLSIFLVFVLQALQTFFDLSFFPGIFRDKTSNFIGGWNELGIFFRFGIITA